METDLYLYTILQPQLHFCREHNRLLYYVPIQHTFSVIEVLLLITTTELQGGGRAHWYNTNLSLPLESSVCFGLGTYGYG